MFNTGLRAAEVLNLKVSDIDWQSEKVMVREAKGKKDRTLWGEAYLKLLRKWIKYQAKLPESAFLFTTSDGSAILSNLGLVIKFHLYLP